MRDQQSRHRTLASNLLGLWRAPKCSAQVPSLPLEVVTGCTPFVRPSPTASDIDKRWPEATSNTRCLSSVSSSLAALRAPAGSRSENAVTLARANTRPRLLAGNQGLSRAVLGISRRCLPPTPPPCGLTASSRAEAAAPAAAGQPTGTTSDRQCLRRQLAPHPGAAQLLGQFFKHTPDQIP